MNFVCLKKVGKLNYFIRYGKYNIHKWISGMLQLPHNNKEVSFFWHRNDSHCIYGGEEDVFLPSLFVYFKKGDRISSWKSSNTLDLHHYCYCTVIVIRDMNHECLKVFLCSKKIYFSCSMAHFHPFLKNLSPSCLLDDTCYAKTWIQTRPLTS